MVCSYTADRSLDPLRTPGPMLDCYLYTTHSYNPVLGHDILNSYFIISLTASFHLVGAHPRYSSHWIGSSYNMVDVQLQPRKLSLILWRIHLLVSFKGVTFVAPFWYHPVHERKGIANGQSASHRCYTKCLEHIYPIEGDGLVTGVVDVERLHNCVLTMMFSQK